MEWYARQHRDPELGGELVRRASRERAADHVLDHAEQCGLPLDGAAERAAGGVRSAGMVAPLKSASRIPVACPERAKARARPVVTKLFPTPPLPLNTATTRRTVASRSATRRRWATI